MYNICMFFLKIILFFTLINTAYTEDANNLSNFKYGLQVYKKANCMGCHSWHGKGGGGYGGGSSLRETLLDYDGIKVRGHVNTSYESLQPYKDRVERYIKKNKDHLSIHKLRNNIPITKQELTAIENILFTESVAGTKKQFIQQYGEKPLGSFIRSITGVEQSVLNEAFADFIDTGGLSADQMTFINTIISYLSKNGTINKAMLYDSPFIDINDKGIDGVFDNNIDKIKVLKIIDQINQNALTA